MIGYKDMTFCSDATDCHNHDVCHRWFSPLEQKKAKEWWGGDGYPVAFSSFKGTCGTYEPNATEFSGETE